MDATYRFGIEEEFFLADAVTRGTPGRAATTFHRALQRRVPEAERELLEVQVEIASPPSASFAEARATLAGLRTTLVDVGREHGIRLLSAGTHPTARWARQRRTQKDRYARIMREAQMIEARNMVCGMHVHVEVPRPEDRVDLMNRMLPFLPVLLALSASSPFWQGRDTGLAAYRLSVWGELPRTGLPDLFRDAADYESYVAALVRAEVIPDASFLWWTLRPSTHYPTLELRVADGCTRLDDALAVAALFRCLVRRLVRMPELNRGQTGAARAIAAENLWRAQRFGTAAHLIEGGGLVPFALHLDRLLDAVRDDAAALGCAGEIAVARRIAAEGTSADGQSRAFAAAKARGASTPEALMAVVDWIADTTASV